MPTLAPSKERSVDAMTLKERIRNRAYEIYIQRGSKPGAALDDWLKAEEEILWDENDDRVDEASEESFPSSDPPAF